MGRRVAQFLLIVWLTLIAAPAHAGPIEDVLACLPHWPQC